MTRIFSIWIKAMWYIVKSDIEKRWISKSRDLSVLFDVLWFIACHWIFLARHWLSLACCVWFWISLFGWIRSLAGTTLSLFSAVFEWFWLFFHFLVLCRCSSFRALSLRLSHVLLLLFWVLIWFLILWDFRIYFCLFWLQTFFGFGTHALFGLVFGHWIFFWSCWWSTLLSLIFFSLSGLFFLFCFFFFFLLLKSSPSLRCLAHLCFLICLWTLTSIFRFGCQSM